MVFSQTSPFEAHNSECLVTQIWDGAAVHAIFVLIQAAWV